MLVRGSPNLMFLSGHETLSSGPHLRVFPNGTLVFRTVSRTRDEGDGYKCRARDRSGKEAEATTKIKVIGEFIRLSWTEPFMVMGPVYYI